MSILLVDSYDSFTFNLKNLIKTATNTTVYTIHNDTFKPEEYKDVDNFLKNFDAIIIGPGPGHPSALKDVGIIPYLFTKTDIPILGICLGFQCLCDAHGGVIRYLKNVKHGQAYDIEVIRSDELFEGMHNFPSVRYHSIYVELEAENSSIIPLAFTDDEGEKILMAAKHSLYPHYGVQYHPESICSEKGDLLMKNFWKLAQKFNQTREVDTHSYELNHDGHILKPLPLFPSQATYSERNIEFQEISVEVSNIDICDYLHEIDEDFLLLNSASSPGEWGIIGIPIPGASDVITHSTQDPKNIKLSKWKGNVVQNISLEHDSTIWSFVANYVEARSFKTKGLADSFPFVGGLIGFFSYEEGEHLDLEKLEKLTHSSVPDTKLCYIERFVLYNLKTKGHYIASIRENDAHWIQNFATRLTERVKPIKVGEESISTLLNEGETIRITMPERKEYVEAFTACQEHLQKGNSYELCLTTTTKLEIPSRIHSWDIYKILTSKNPSPYSCFMSFDNCELLSSSPERFLSWNDDYCQLRPIKGTVKKGGNMTLEKAMALLKTPKEMGENLMIVDLIRHDLYTFLNEIEVAQLMTVEEYKTVYQLVSVINGSFKDSPYRGLDILSQSLPPGSMTGAPKKRSVEILQSLEKQRRRGIYSGVCGYYSLNNKSDWSVVIRSCFNYKDDLENSANTQVWRIGAGGAITVLSDCTAEWEEMELKLESALQAFKS